MNIFRSVAKRCSLPVILAACLVGPAALADMSILKGLAACRAESDSLKRLVCYDRLAAAVSPENAPEPDAEPAKAPVDNFGGEALEKEEGPASIEAVVTNEFTGFGKGAVFELDNGQVWIQVDDTRYRFPEGAGTKVTIRRRAFGTYRLAVEGSNRTVRVKRRK